MMWGGALGLLPILSFPPGECCQTSLNFFFPLFSPFFVISKNHIFSFKKIDRIFKHFCQSSPSQPAGAAKHPSTFSFHFFLLFLSKFKSKQFKRKSADYLLQTCKCNFFSFKTQDEKVNWWTENRKPNKNKTHLARRKLGNAVENVWKRWDCSRSQRKLIWTLKKSSQCGYLSSWDSNWRIFSFLLKICYVCVVHLYVHVDDDKEMLMIVLMASRIADWIIMEDKLIDLQLKACFCPSLHRDQINWNVFTLGKSKVDIFSMGLIMNMGRKNIWDLISSIICW